MVALKPCRECGVPRRFAREHAWLKNGTIVQSKNPDHRMIFIELDNITSTFQGVEEILGIPIDRIIVEAKRRATYDFVDHMLPGVVKAVVRLVGVRPVIRNVTALGRVMGYGMVELARMRRAHSEGDYVTISASELYSLPLFSGDLAGSFNAIDRREVGITHVEVSPGEYEITAHITPHPLELQERLKAKPYANKEGDIELERCPVCGLPRALSFYEWIPERGVILHRESGRRMVALGPATLDAVISELEKELGEEIPRVVAEAQRRFLRSGFYGMEEARSREDLRRALALRGLGNLVGLEWGENRLRFHIENPCLEPVLAGLVWGIFELVTGRDGRVEWEEREDGDLLVEATTA
ncbi:MAG: hypothetical protein HPY75_04375 [Actinobacteria bacterium]|nr:hypothetical protein [Actinomycetota bacterium]